MRLFFSCNPPLRILLILFVFATSCMAGTKFKSFRNYIINENIEYTTAKVSMNIDSNGVIVPAKYLIIIKNSTRELKGYDHLKKEDWLRLLKDDSTDWATNLILYWKYKKDAHLLKEYNRDKWLYDLKNSDIDYWEIFLK